MTKSQDKPQTPRGWAWSMRRLLALCAASALLIVAQAPRAAAQSNQNQPPPMPPAGGGQVQVIPSQPHHLPPRPKKPARGNALQIPSLPQSAQPEASNPVHTIPQAFFGCWRGTSLPSDSAQYLGGCGQAYEIPETQELCFRRVGDGGFEIVSQSASSALANFRDHAELISSQGDRRVNLSDAGSYDLPGLFSSDSVAFSGSSRCDLSKDKESLSCRGTSLFRCNGRPWYRTTGRVVMRRLPP
ncbi:MAG TPA: hypothetical protein VFE56_05475 [Candidatus Binataceae bacterium]|nr:hypothetical protein [Candidatus Binataceae bacterium]